MRIHLPLPRLEINKNQLKINVFLNVMRIYLPLPWLEIDENRLGIDVLARARANSFAMHSLGSKSMKID